MKIYAVLGAIVISSAFATHTREAVMKCAPNTPVLFPNAPENVFLLNTKVVTQEEIQVLKGEGVESVEIICATDLHRVFGIEARRSGVIVFTTPGPTTALKLAMRSIEKAQQDYFARHGTFATRLSDLAWRDESGLITVTLTANEAGDGWSAKATHRYRIDPSWAVSVSGAKKQER